MSEQPKGHAHNWKGGRVVSSNGYVLVYVGKEHHLADVRGYAYEHRLAAEKKLGRRLRNGEQVHHLDEDKQNNSPDNLLVVEGVAEHRLHHRQPGSRRRLPGEPNPEVSCACGCGRTFLKYDAPGRPRHYVSGHNQPQGAFTDDLLWFLRNVPEPSTTVYLASFFGTDERKVTAALSSLKRQGKVIRRGKEWGVA